MGKKKKSQTNYLCPLSSIWGLLHAPNADCVQSPGSLQNLEITSAPCATHCTSRGKKLLEMSETVSEESF